MSSEDGRVWIEAHIRFLTTAEGGRYRPPSAGLRSQLRIGSIQTSCIVEPLDDRPEMSLGEGIDVRITLLFPDQYGELLHGLESIELSEGSKIVARGFVT